MVKANIKDIVANLGVKRLKIFLFSGKSTNEMLLTSFITTSLSFWTIFAPLLCSLIFKTTTFTSIG